MIFWFLPIFVAMSTLRIKGVGLADYIIYVQLSLVLLGLFYLLMQSTSVRVSFSVLFLHKYTIFSVYLIQDLLVYLSLVKFLIYSL